MLSFSELTLNRHFAMACLLIPLMSLNVFAEGETSFSTMEPTGLAGIWKQTKEFDNKLGYTDREASMRKRGSFILPASSVEIIVDKNFGDTMKNSDDMDTYRQYVRQEGHELSWTGHLRMSFGDEVVKSVCVFTQRNGLTYLWRGVVNVGLLPVRVMLVPGATESQSLLFLDFDPIRDTVPTARRSLSVAAYDRSTK